MGHMELQSEYGLWYLVQWDDGDATIPHSVLTPGERAALAAGDMDAAFAAYGGGCSPNTFEASRGWCARWSAPGYLDATEWCGPFDSEEEARAAIAHVCDDDADDGF